MSKATDAAWQEGHDEAAREADEVVLRKDAFIFEQAAIIVRLMAVIDLHDAWGSVDDDLAEQLRSYA